MTGERDDRRAVVAARRAVLAAAVLDDLDVVPGDDGVTVLGALPVHLSWRDVTAAVADAPPGSTLSRRRVLRETALHGALARPGLPDVHLLGLPAARIPDETWPVHRVPGGALVVGFGVDVSGAGGGQSLVPLPTRLQRLLPPRPDVLPERQAELERLAALATARLARQPDGLVPQGWADVPTLLTAAPLRRALADACPGGLRSVALPSRLRGWLDARRVDPAFVPLAYSLLPDDEQAFDRVLLVSAEEVALAPRGDLRP